MINALLLRLSEARTTSGDTCKVETLRDFQTETFLFQTSLVLQPPPFPKFSHLH